MIAQIYGCCLTCGSELATTCDLVYVAEDAQIGYPPVGSMSPPDMQFHLCLVGLRNALEMMLTGDSISGTVAVEKGFANRAVSAGELEERLLEMAKRTAKVPSGVQQFNKGGDP